MTVGIPFFDEEAVLEAAVRSVLAQTMDDLEVLLVDDGSTDRSLTVARSFDDPRVLVLSDGRRRGLPARLNEIVGRARGELVARMDADDVSHPERLAREVEVFDRGGYDAVGTWAALVDDRGEPFGVVEDALPGSERVALERGLLAHATVLARRAWLAENPYDEALTRAEDRDLWCRVVGRARLGVVPEVLYVVRVSPRDVRFLADYAESQRQNRILFARYGPGSVGVARAARLWGASYAKTMAMRAAVRAGLGEALLRRRGRPPTASERLRVAEALAAAQRP